MLHRKDSIKEGDRLLCKKNYTAVYNRSFKKNQQYEISHINHDNTIFVPIDKKGVWFHPQIDELWYMDDYIWDYFYTKQEVRQLKLKQIDNEV